MGHCVDRNIWAATMAGNDDRDRDAARPQWSMVIAYYNEADFIGATLASIGAQSLRLHVLILVDNGSTDAGPALAAHWAAQNPDIAVHQIAELRPGQVHALATGIAAVTTTFVAIGDADTFYPPDYLARANTALAADPAVVAVFAHNSAGAPGSIRERSARWARDLLLIGLWRGQTYAGGYGHAYRTAALRAAGGCDPVRWNLFERIL